MKNLNALIKVLVLASMSLAVTACSTASVRTMPGEDINRVIARDIEREDAEEAAVDAAAKYCRDQKRSAIFVRTETKYTGSIDEAQRQMIRNGSTAAMILGSGLGTQRNSPNLLASAGMVGNQMTSDRDYEVVSEFRCM